MLAFTVASAGPRGVQTTCTRGNGMSRAAAGFTQQVPISRALVTKRRLRVVVADALDGGNLALQAASSLAWSTVIYFAVRLLFQEGSHLPEGARECPRCHGTGKEDCACTRWSDGDVGCPACTGPPGKTTCRACGGGGTAVPIQSKLYVAPNDNLRDYQ